MSDHDYHNIQVKCHSHGVALITISREAKHNALNSATLRELMQAFAQLQDEAAVRCVMLTGAGERAFSAGADIEEMSTMTAAQGKDFARLGQMVTELIENLGKPVIAAINGLSYGGGCELALACTLRVAVAHAKFAESEVTIGVMPGFGGSQRLPRIVGKGRAFEMILTGTPITAEQAATIGLVNRVVAHRAELLLACEEWCAKICANAPLSIKYALEAVNHGLEVSLEEGLLLESTLFGLCFATEDMREGTRAFLEKRPPRFSGK
jgi:enoyl-CoA hydratase